VTARGVSFFPDSSEFCVGSGREGACCDPDGSPWPTRAYAGTTPAELAAYFVATSASVAGGALISYLSGSNVTQG
jgi:hypothetical protein